MNKITVVDSPCGSGKTSYMIDMINNNQIKNYLYITPFIREVDRIIDKTKLSEKVFRFKQPVNKGNGKMSNLINLLTNNCDIVSTHYLFHACKNDVTDIIKAGHYTLILDEVMDVVEIMKIKNSDLQDLMNHSKIEEGTGKLLWTDSNYDGDNFPEIYRLCKNGHIYILNGIAIIWTFPIELFEAFDEIYICTYMFNAQIQNYYYNMYNIKYTKVSVRNKKIIPYEFEKANTDKINILDNSKLNNIGNGKYDLSKTWYNENKNNHDFIRKNMVNYVKNILPKLTGTKIKCDDIIWTTFKDYKSKLAGKGYTKSFLACNSRATNDYVNSFIVMYPINIYMNPIISQFFTKHGVTVNQEEYALSEMIQFIYRSAIREGHQIYCYIPSERMRNLLREYIEK